MYNQNIKENTSNDCRSKDNYVEKYLIVNIV